MLVVHICLWLVYTEKDVDTLPVGTQSDDEDSVSQVSDSGEAEDEDMVSDAPSSLASVPRAMHTHYPPQQPMTYQCEYPGCGAVSFSSIFCCQIICNVIRLLKLVFLMLLLFNVLSIIQTYLLLYFRYSTLNQPLTDTVRCMYYLDPHIH